MKEFRIFLSSTFGDFVEERTLLQEKVFPRLQRLCAEHGATLTVVDLRWGVGESVQTQNKTIEVCIEEIKKCQEYTTKPNFLILLGDRYGWRPLPRKIKLKEFESILVSASTQDYEIISSAYEGPDLNSLDPYYLLKAFGGDPARHYLIEKRVRLALQRSRVKNELVTKDGSDFLSMSATHQEILVGALRDIDDQLMSILPERHVHAFERKMPVTETPEEKRYLFDWDQETQAIDISSAEDLNQLKKQLERRIGSNYHKVYCDGMDESSRKIYLERFCEEVYASQATTLMQEFKTASTGRDDKDLPRRTELSPPAFGVEESLAVLTEYLASDNPGYFIVTGEMGAGKTRLVEELISSRTRTNNDERIWFYDASCFLQFRDMALLNLLDAISQDLSIFSGAEFSSSSSESEACRSFESILSNLKGQTTHIVIIDNLNSLEKNVSSQSLAWLPESELTLIKVVIVQRKGALCFISPFLLPRCTIYDLPRMSDESAIQLLDWILENRCAEEIYPHESSVGRRLQPLQKASILAAFRENSNPLWLKLVCLLASEWRSWNQQVAPLNLSSLPAKLEQLIAFYVSRYLVEVCGHASCYVRKTLLYISCSRHGLSEDELRELQVNDKDIISEFNQRCAETNQKWLQVDHLPPILWSRLFRDLRGVVESTSVNGQRRIQFPDIAIRHIVKEVFELSSQEEKVMHQAIARLHLSRLQPLNRQFALVDASKVQDPYALRSLSEIGWHLNEAGDEQGIASLMEDINYLMAKCAALQVGSLLSERSQSSRISVGSLSNFIVKNQGLLLSGDRIWPSHRIAVQLGLEDTEVEISTVFRQWLSQHHADWAIYVSSFSTKQQELKPVRHWSAMLPFQGRATVISSEHSRQRDLAVICDSRSLFGVCLHSGQLLYQVRVGSIQTILDMGSHLIALCEQSQSLIALNSHNGSTQWQIELGATVLSIKKCGEDHLWASTSSNLFRLSAANGSIKNNLSIPPVADGALSRLDIHECANSLVLELEVSNDNDSGGRVDFQCFICKSLGNAAQIEPKGLILSLNGRCRVNVQLHPLLNGYLAIYDPECREFYIYSSESQSIVDGVLSKLQQAVSGIEDACGEFDSGSSFQLSSVNDAFILFRFCDVFVSYDYVNHIATTIAWKCSTRCEKLNLSQSRILLTPWPDDDGFGPEESVILDLVRNELTKVSLPSIRKPALLDTHGEHILLANRPLFDSDSGFTGKPSPLFDINLSSGEVRLIGNTVNCTYDGLLHDGFYAHPDSYFRIFPSGAELIDISSCPLGDHLVFSQSPYSLGSSVIACEDRAGSPQLFICGNEAAMKLSFREPTPYATQLVPHPFCFGVSCSYAGPAAILLEDERGGGEIPGIIQFRLLAVDQSLSFIPGEYPNLGMDLNRTLPVEYSLDVDLTCSVVIHRGFFLVLQGDLFVAFEIEADISASSDYQYRLIGAIRDTRIVGDESQLDYNYVIDGERFLFKSSELDGAWVYTSLGSHGFSDLVELSHETSQIEFINKLEKAAPLSDLSSSRSLDLEVIDLGEGLSTGSLKDCRSNPELGPSFVEIGDPDREGSRWYSASACHFLPHCSNYPDVFEGGGFTSSASTTRKLTFAVRRREYLVVDSDGAVSVLSPLSQASS